MYSIKNKIIAILLITVIAVGNFALIGNGISISYASNSNLENQSIATNNENVEFDAYFMSQNNKMHTLAQDIVSKTTLYLDVEVKKTGYLKDVSVEIDANFKVDESTKQEEIQKIENNKIELNQMNGNTGKTTIALPIYFDANKTINIGNFSRQNDVTLKATYIDDKGKEHKVEKTINNQLNWVATPELQIEQAIQKYIPYTIEDEKGIIIEQKVKVGIKDNILPIAESNVEIEVPKIENKTPEIIVRKEGKTETLTSDKWSYNSNNGKLIIKETNIPTTSGEINWNSQEEYIITYRYENIEKQKEINFLANIVANVKTYGGEVKKLNSTCQKENKLTETIGDIVEIQTKFAQENISKGYLYTNLENKEKLEISYQVNYDIDIAYSKVADEIILTTNQSQWKMEEEETASNSYFKELCINTQNFNNILGEQGYIEVLSNNKEVARIISNHEENITINIEASKLKELTLKTSKPQKEGILEITATKAIKEENMAKEQIQKITNLEEISSIGMNKDKNKSSIPVIEPTSKLEVEISKTQFSTVLENEEVEIKATLKTNSEYDSLYKNPTIEIVLPKEMENIEILGTELLYEDELKIENVQIIDGANKVIRITLSGNQTKYSINEVSNGATIVLRANITVNNLTPTKTEKIQILYTNPKTAQNGSKTVEIKYIAPTGLVPINTISNYAQNKQIRSIAGSSEQGIIEVSAPARTATSEIQLINNYTNKINNISILGRTLTTETTSTELNKKLENTFDAIMTNTINSKELTNEQYIVYYSENGEATKDLNLSSNGWTQNIGDLSKVKSYLIVLPNYEMNTGDSIKFSYEMQIPEGLNYSEKVNSVYTVYFDNVQEKQTIADKVIAEGVSLTTGKAPKLETTITSYTQENETVREGQYIKFKATVKNTGSMDAENVALNITAPSGNIYYYIENEKINFTDNLNGKEGTLVATYKTKHTEFVEDNYTSEYIEKEEANRTIAVGSLKAGETREVEYELKIDEVNIIKTSLPMQDGKLVIPELTIKNSANVIADKMTKAIESNQYKFKLEEGKMQVMVSTDKASDYILTKGSKLTYTARVENISTENSLKQLEVTVKIPEGLKISQTSTKNRVLSAEDKKVDITTNGNTVTFKVEEYSKEDSIDFIVETQVENTQGAISPIVTAKAENIEEHTANVVSNKVQLLNFSIEQQKLDKEYFKEGEEITYTYRIKNNSDVYADSFIFENKIPEGTTFEKAEIITQEGTQKITSIEDNKLVIEKTDFKESEEITIKVTVIANKISSGEKEKQIENYAVIYGNLFEKVESNHITSIIEYNKNAHNDNSGENDDNDGDNADTIDGRYKVSGIAWIDSNKNGQRDENEQKIEGLKVRLYNQENQSIVKDMDTQKEKITTTTDAGKYTFENIPEGKYVVVFEYDNSKYMLTQYQKEEVSKIENSDVISMEMNIDGTEKIVAVSDTLEIKDSNIRNIDIGIYIAPKSDLSLEKYINKVTLTYGDTTKTYDYNNAKIAKVEVPGKSLSQSTVIVEYKIVVTNEGDIANYVKKIVDYIPNDMKFNAELNKDWYQSSNGDLYNASLANVELQPGESKEVTLTLTKKMTENGTGMVNNNAEIYETYNKEAISDIDSTEANKVSKEDDMSSADLVISIKTGEIVGIVGVISMLICIAIVGIAYIFYKKMKKVIYSRRRG